VVIRLPVSPFAFDSHEWSTGEIATQALLQTLPKGRIGEDILDGDITGITGTTTVVKANTFNYNDSREIKVSAYGTFIGATPDLVTARLWWSGSEIMPAYETYIPLNLLQLPVCMFGTVFPGAPGSASAYVTLERAGSGTVIAKAGWRIVVEDIGGTAGIYST
jgi:hypothetical protein